MINQKILEIIKHGRERQKNILPIFNYLYNILITNDIYYTISYGTLLGAVLYQNFIPWDDDIDLVIDREDINTIETIIDQKYSIKKLYKSLYFFFDNNTGSKIDIFIADKYLYQKYNIKEEYDYVEIKNYKVRIPKNYKQILDETYGNDWEKIAYISNHKWAEDNLKELVAFSKQNKEHYHKLPVSFVKDNIINEITE